MILIQKLKKKERKISTSNFKHTPKSQQPREQLIANKKMVEPIFDYQFRLILIGDSTVGKSSLLKYFTDGRFAEVRSNILTDTI